MDLHLIEDDVAAQAGREGRGLALVEVQVQVVRAAVHAREVLDLTADVQEERGHEAGRGGAAQVVRHLALDEVHAVGTGEAQGAGGHAGPQHALRLEDAGRAVWAQVTGRARAARVRWGMADPFEQYREPGPKRIGLYLSLWAALAATAALKPRGREDMGTLETLRRSHFSRVMFADIGALSTLGALYAVTRSRSPLRFVAGGLTLVVGSFALLPYLAWEDWRAWRARRGDAEA